MFVFIFSFTRDYSVAAKQQPEEEHGALLGLDLREMDAKDVAPLPAATTLAGPVALVPAPVSQARKRPPPVLD